MEKTNCPSDISFCQKLAFGTEPFAKKNLTQKAFLHKNTIVVDTFTVEVNLQITILRFHIDHNLLR